MRAVLDSNVLFLLMELRRVRRYPRLQRVHGLDDEKIERAVLALESAAATIQVRAEDVVRVVPDDPDDDHVVAAALVAGADVLCIISNDQESGSRIRRWSQVHAPDL